jgi:predicted ATPase
MEIPPSLAAALRDRYRLERFLARGGMGDVYVARDLRHPRNVAIKVFRSEIGRLVGPERFQREIEILAPLVHPLIVPLLDSGSTPDALYYVMPMVEGESLANRLERERHLPLDEALRITREIADALDYAHGRGFVHRDIKPGNILLADSHALLTDFGIARMITAPGNDSITRSDEIVGTPAYMSPEQIFGTSRVDGRSDQYSLALVLREMLTGERPQRGPAFEPLTSADTYSVFDHSATPAAVALCLSRALSDDPTRRFRTVRELADALLAGADSNLAGPTPHNLPMRRSTFIGRDEQIRDGRKLLSSNRLVTLVGSGGCGKTRLAVRIAELSLEDGYEAIHYVDLAPVSDSERVPAVVASVLGVHGASEEMLAEALKGRRLLLMDNCEHVLSSSGRLVGRLLELCPRLTVLATSRELLHVEGEQVLRVPAMGLPPRGETNPAVAQQADSLRLFRDRAQLVAPAFVVDQANLASVIEICRRLDGIPLAIELAAARIRVLSPTQIEARLSDRFRLLTGGTSAEPPRHRTLRAAVEWSYDLLDPDERELLAALSVFAGSWTLAAATAVAGDASGEYPLLDRMTRLVDKSLIFVEAESIQESRYRLLETINQFAFERLEVSPQATAVRKRHLDFFLGLAEAAEQGSWGPEQGAWFDRLERDHDDILNALTWCARKDGPVLEGMALGGAMYRFWYSRGHIRVPRRLLGELLRAPGAEQPVQGRAKALYAAGGFAIYQGDLDEATRLLAECLSIFRALGNRQGIGRALVGISNAALAAGRLAEARETLKSALEIYRGLEEQRSLQVVLLNLAEVSLAEGDLTDARRLYIESLEYGGNPVLLASSLAGLGRTLVRLGNPLEASPHVSHGLEMVREVKGFAGVELLDAAAETLLGLDHPEEASQVLAACTTLRHKLGFSRTNAWEAAARALREDVARALGGREPEASRGADAWTLEEACERARRALTDAEARRPSTA